MIIKWQISIADVENLARSLPNLVELDLSDAKEITHESIEHISNNFKNLEYLGLSRCYMIPKTSYRWGFSFIQSHFVWEFNRWSKKSRLLCKLKQLLAIDLFNVINVKDFTDHFLRQSVTQLKFINRYPFSSIARPTVGFYRNRLWGRQVWSFSSAACSF